MRRAGANTPSLLHAVACAASAWLGCAPPATPHPARPDLTPARPGAGESCASAKDPLHPVIVEWPATSRADLQASADQGPVVVSYGGCALKVLTGCRAGSPGSYRLDPTTPSEQRFEIHSTRDLYADLPLGVVSLRGRLEEGTSLTLTYATVGARVLERPPAVLQGDCAGATHYVDSMLLGAFSLVSHAAVEGKGSGDLVVARVGGAEKTVEQISGSSGDVASCKERGLSAGSVCQAVLELSLRPLQLVGGKVAAAGFGLGLAPPEKVPAISPLSMPPWVGDFAQVDATLLELLQGALEAEKDPGLAGAGKAEAWDRLAHYASGRPYAASAAARRDEWLREDRAQRARDAQIVSVCPRYRADLGKLERLRRLTPDVLDPSVRGAYEREFEMAYRPWPELARCSQLEAAAISDAAWPALHGADDGMVRVRGGTFDMGSSTPGDHASPVHTVTVADFQLDVTEVTVEQYARCQRAGACTQRGSDFASDISRCNDTHPLHPYSVRGGELTDQAPANCVTFAQAEAFCHWAGKRLPTEEEWEYAARGTGGRTYPWGEWGKDSDGNSFFPIHYCANASATIGYRAGSYASNASPFGVRDMAGSVWEWTTSLYADAYGAPPKRQERVMRGGGDDDCSEYDAAYRLGRHQDSADSSTGMRCAR